MGDFLPIGIILFVVLIIVIWWISTSNKLSRGLIKIEEADSGIDVALTKRYDVLTKMVEVVKGYTKHEKETIMEVINLRQKMTMQEKNDANTKMDAGYNKIMALAESYPDLKASENFLVLQKAIVDVEEHLQAARRLYNANVTRYNELVQMVPSNLVAKARKLTTKEFFVASETEKANVDIKL